MENFKSAVLELSQSSPEQQQQLNTIFGECQDLADQLLVYLKEYVEDQSVNSDDFIVNFINKVLETLEILLHNESYRSYIEQSPEMIDHIILLFEKLKSNESRVLVLRMISQMGLSMESRLEFCRKEGFRKLFELLMNQNETIAKEVLKTMRYFLEAGTNIQPPDIDTGIKTKIKNVIYSAASIAFRFFPTENQEVNVQTQEIEAQVQLPPNEGQIKQAVNRLEARKFQQEFEEVTSPLGSPQKLVSEELEEDVVKGFMRVQGALYSLTYALHEAALEVKLDLMDMLGILLLNNVKNQREFRKIEGYQLISDLFDRLKNYDTSESSQNFLMNSFQILKRITLNGQDSHYVGNMQSFLLLLHIITTSPQISVVGTALQVIQDLVDMSWENALCFFEGDGIDYLQKFLERVCLYENQKIGSYENESEFVECSQEKYFELFNRFEQLLKFVAFIMGNSSDKNTIVLSICKSVLMNENLKESYVENLLQLQIDLLSDLNSRCNGSYLSRNSFMLSYNGVEESGQVVLHYYQQYEELCLGLICQYCLYDKQFLQYCLQSQSDNIKSVLIAFVQNKQFVDFLFNHKDYLAIVLCQILNSREYNWMLMKLLDEGEVKLVTQILLLDDYPAVDKLRGEGIRNQFLSENGLLFIEENFHSLDVLYLLVAATKNSVELKIKFFQHMSHTTIAELVPKTIDSLYILMELSLEDDFLVETEYYLQIKSGLPQLMHLQAKQLLTINEKTEMSSTMESQSYPLNQIDNDNNNYNQRVIFDQNIMGFICWISDVSAELQYHGLSHILQLAQTYYNKRVFTTLQIGNVLLSLLPAIDISNHSLVFQILTELFSYSISQSEIDKILNFAQEKASMHNTKSLDLIRSCLQLNIAKEFYYLQNSTLQSQGIHSLPKSGYSVMFWVKLSEPGLNPSRLFSWVDHNRGLVLFQVTYNHAVPGLEKKTSGAQTPLEVMKSRLPLLQSGISKSQLSIQTTSQAFFPSTDDSCSADLELTKDWTHICLTHSKAGANLYVNGMHITGCKAGYLNNLKDKFNLTGVIGDNQMVLMVSGVICIEGTIEQVQLQNIVTKGPLLFEISKKIEGRVIFQFSENQQQPELCQVTEVIDEQQAEMYSDMPMNTFITDNLYIFPRSYLHLTQNKGLYHITSPIKLTIYHNQYVQLFMSMISKGFLEYAFQFVCESITKCQENYELFKESQGWQMFYTILTQNADDLNGEIMELLIYTICDQPIRDINLITLLSIQPEKLPSIHQDRAEGIVLVFDLLEILNPTHFQNCLKILGNLLYKEQNVQLFLSPQVGGLQKLLNFVTKFNNPLYEELSQVVLAIFEHIIEHLNQDHIDILLDFISSPDLKHHISQLEDMIVQILCLISLHIFYNQTILDKWIASDGFILLFDLLKNQSELLRCQAIKMIGIIIHMRPKQKAWFYKNKGFDMISCILGKHSNTTMMLDLLIDSSLNGMSHVNYYYPLDCGIVKLLVNNSLIAETILMLSQLPQNLTKIVYAEFIEVAIELLKGINDDTIKNQIFQRLQESLIDQNAERLLDTSFIMWCANLVKIDYQNNLFNFHYECKYHQTLYLLIAEICIFDFNRSSKQNKVTPQMTKIPDADQFWINVTFTIFQHLEQFPNLSTSESKITNIDNFLKSFMQFLTTLNIKFCNSELTFRMMHLINLLASENNPQIRGLMKNSEYFNLRDDLLIEAIRSDLTHEELEDVITNFSFEAIASRSKFRDNYGPVYLVILLLETSNVGIQLSILNKIQNEVCINDDNKKQLKKVIDSKAIVEFLSHTSLGQIQSSMMPCFKSAKNQEQQESNLEQSPEQFLEWLNQQESQKKALIITLRNYTSNIDQRIRKARVKAEEAKIQNRKKAYDLILKLKTSTQKLLNELDLKLISRLAKSEDRAKERFHSERRSRQARSSSLSKKSGI